MEEKKNNRYHIFFRVIFAFFILFLCLYSISVNGFIETSNKNKTLYTEEQIRKFEEDVNNGNFVNIEKYIEGSEVDYSNEVSRIGESISTLIDDGSKYVIEMLEKFFSFLFE